MNDDRIAALESQVQELMNRIEFSKQFHGDIEITDSIHGVILKSPNGTKYRVQVDNAGALTVTAL